MTPEHERDVDRIDEGPHTPTQVGGSGAVSRRVPGGRPVGPTAIGLGLFFFSGAAALVYQVLWVRELRLLFGSTAQSAAIAIAIFFAGIAAGGAFWGRRVERSSNPLRVFGLLEIGVAVAALGHFAVVDVYHRLYPTLHAWFGTSGGGDTALKAVVATTLLFPAAFLMGGTLPAMGEHLIGRNERSGLATTGTTIYSVNTLGSATGALGAGFVLPQMLGYRWAYLLAVGVDAAVGALAVGMARVARRRAATKPPPTAAPSVETKVERRPSDSADTHVPTFLIWVIAAASGLTTLSMEVVWTRLMAQVLQNSAYTYSIVLTTFLLALSVGAFLAGRLARAPLAPTRVLIGLLVLAGGAAAASPLVFHRITDGASYVGGDLSWGPYLALVGVVSLSAIGLPAVALGAVLPYLLRMLVHLHRSPGRVLGGLVAANTSGAILGSLAGGFVVLPLLGAWRGVLVLAAVYPVLAFVTWTVVDARTRRLTPARIAWSTLSVSAFTLVTAIAVVAAPITRLVDAAVLRDGEVLVESRHGPQADVAVVGIDDDLAIRVNTTYTLGGTRGLNTERDQALVPLLAHPNPASVFFLGMGTGLTAGASLSLPLERVVVCELIDDVVELSRAHFGEFTNGLFDDARVTVISEDGRNCLARTDERYDAIISDLFVPWEAGTGYLYTRDHYEMSATRLEPGGVYVQWIPLYQVSMQELGIIARTMDEVFDEVTAWRGDMFATRSALALVGHLEATTLDPDAAPRAARSIPTAPFRTQEQLDSMLLRLYVGNITRSAIFANERINTDDRPLIEQLTPRTHRDVRAGRRSFVVAEERERFYDAVADAVPPEDDPHLSDLTPQQLDAVTSGRIYSRYRLADHRGAREAAELLDAFRSLAPPRATGDLSPARTLLPRQLPGPARPDGS